MTLTARFAALLAVTCSGPALATGQLPAGIKPILYDITVTPNATAMTFTGSETIDIEVTQPTRTITLNAAALTNVTATFDGKPVSTVALDAAKQTVTVTLPAEASRGRHKLGFSWSGKINTTASGLFATDYPDGKGGTARLLVTQFEAPDARRFAPMWDEPAHKARFKLTAIAPAGQTAFSNMPAEQVTKAADGSSRYSFGVTPVMSSYLLFLGMGEVERKAKRFGNTEVGIITRPGVSDQGDYAMEAAGKLLAYYNDYFGTPYPLPKLDMIAAPGSSQFFSAMENWGAILYFEPVLLFDPQRSSESDRQNIYYVVAHEVAHQWFGNIVTMRWWDDLWLNEGYASWMGTKATGDLNPEWNMPLQSVAFGREQALGLDARASTHPIIQPVQTPDQINQAFDAITYLKGQAVVGLLESAAGAEPFREGVRGYMKKYAYGNTVTDQLWAEIDAKATRKVTDIAHDFTRQGGVPLVRLSSATCSGGATSATLSQGRFALDSSKTAGGQWRVPLTLATVGGQPTQAVVTAGPAQTISVPGCGPLILGQGRGTYARLQYDAKTHATLIAAFDRLEPIDQAGTLADDFAFAYSGDQDLKPYLATLGAVKPDAHPVVLQLVASQVRRLQALFEGTPTGERMGGKVSQLLSPALARIGYEPKAGEPANQASLRELLIIALGTAGDKAVVDRARGYVGQLERNPAAIPAGIRTAILAAYAKGVTPAEWDRLHALARGETNPVARETYIALLGSARDEVLATRAMQLTLTDELTDPQKAQLLSVVAGEHPDLAFDFATTNLAALGKWVEPNALARYVVDLAGGSNDPAMPAKLRRFAEANMPADARGPVDRVINGIEVRAAIRQRVAGDVEAWVR